MSYKEIYIYIYIFKYNKFRGRYFYCYIIAIILKIFFFTSQKFTFISYIKSRIITM